MSDQIEKKIVLAPPGAGLPLTQMLFIRLWLKPFVSRLSKRRACREQYERYTEKLIARISSIPLASRSVKVLINPLPGLEDSSRYWSLDEVLEHLLIVSKNIEGVILSLSSGNIPPGVADTAKVKPKGMATDALAEFTSYAPGLFSRLDDQLAQPGFDFNSPTTFRHPWFKSLNAKQWYWLLGSHQEIHYRQAKSIIRGLDVKR